MEAAPHPWPTLGVLLLRDGLVTKDELEAILDEQRDSRQQRMSGRRLGEILIERGRVTATQVAKLVAEQYELPYVELEPSDVDVKIARRLDEASARRLSAVPINVRPDGSLMLAIADPSTVLFSDELRRLLGSVPQFAVVGPEALEATLDVVYDPANDPAPSPVGPVDALIVADANGEPPPDYFGSGRAVAHLWPPLGALLVREGLISDAELETALAQQRLSTSHRLGEILVERGVVSRSVIARLVAEQYELPFVELSGHDVDPAVARLLPEEMARAYPAVPIARRPDGTLEVAIADPTNVFYSDDLHRALGVPLSFMVASPDAIEALVAFAHSAPPADPAMLEDAADRLEAEADVATELDEAPAPTWDSSLAFDDLSEEPPVSEAETLAELEAEVAYDDTPPEPELAAEEPVEAETPALEQAEEELVEALLAQAAPSEPAPTPGAVEEEQEAQAEAEAQAETAWSYEPEHDDVPGQTIALVPDPEPEEPVVISLVEPAHEPAEPADAPTSEESEPADTVQLYPDTPETAPVFSLVEPHWEVDRRDDESSEERPATTDTDVADPAPVLALASEPVEEGPTADEAAVAEETATEDAAAVAEETATEDEPEADATQTEAEPVASIVAQALSAGATSLHVSPREEGLLVRARVDGVVRELGAVPSDEREALVAELRDAGLDVHVLPTKRGDKITAHAREAEPGPTSLDELGLAPEALETVRAALDRPLGVTVACGPFGSGVTTTLYAALRELDANERILATLERPVARLLEGVDQVDVDPSSGVTFASGLESLVAADTDVVVVGELADHETAEAVFRAALSGRRILTSLTMPDAATAFRRLADLGLEPTVVAAALTCVVAQQLVRLVCAECRETYYASEAELATLGAETSDAGPRLLVRGRGCPACGGTGFRGRTGVFQVVPAHGRLIDLAAAGASIEELRRAVAEVGAPSLRDEAVRLCLEGVTTADEVRRVFGAA